MLTQVQLVNGSQSLTLFPAAGVASTSLDWGFPDVRGVADDAVGIDGTNDTTAYHGASAVVVELTLYQGGSTRAWIDAIRAFCHPGLRPYLVVSDDEWVTQRRIQLRTDQQTAPIVSGKGVQRLLHLGWRAPAGRWEDVGETITDIRCNISDGLGVATPVVTPVIVADSSGTGAVTVPNAGTVPVSPLLRMYGPATGPAATLMATGQLIGFTTGLTLGGGQYVDVDTVAKTAYLLGDPAQDVTGFIDFVNTDWWQVPANGGGLVLYSAYSASTGAMCEVHTRTQWL